MSFIGSIVFYDQSQNGYSQASAASPDKQHNQVVQVAKPGDVVSKARYSSVSKARQDARVHIFTAALLEHICALYEPNPDKQRKVLQGKTTDLIQLVIFAFVTFL